MGSELFSQSLWNQVTERVKYNFKQKDISSDSWDCCLFYFQGGAEHNIPVVISKISKEQRGECQISTLSWYAL